MKKKKRTTEPLPDKNLIRLLSSFPEASSLCVVLWAGVDVNEDDVWVWTMERSRQKERKPEGQNLPGGAGGAWNGAWPAGGMLPNAEEPGPLPKASKLAKPPWEGVWPVGGENMKVMFI